jgi:hypothetical protein
MGAGVMHPGGVVPEASAAAFAAQVISLYTTNLGEWAGTIVGVSALFVMFTTLITILDGFPRLLATGVQVLRAGSSKDVPKVDRSPLLYALTGLLTVAAAATLLWLMGSFKGFIDFVTITAFIVGPITALLNHIAITSPAVPAEYRPSTLMRRWSMLGIGVLSLLAMLYIYARFT